MPREWITFSAEGGQQMATFITTIRFTPQGITKIQDTGKRVEAFKGTAKKMGCKITGIYWTLGAFDGVLVFEAPDDDTATALMLNLASQGNVQTRTARAFTESEIEKILAKSK
jgi:uncharacterized protein with GYD domain